MYLSKPLSGLCLWENSKGKSGYKKADPSDEGRDGEQQPF